jgi:hypothetical protein
MRNRLVAALDEPAVVAVLVVVVVVVAISGATEVEAGRPTGTATRIVQELDQQPRFVPDVVEPFNALAVRPDAMGLELYGNDPSACRHIQATIRTEAADGTPYFYAADRFSDPGQLDHQSARVAWGDDTDDGTFDEFLDAFGGRSGLTLDVTDDDDGWSRAMARVPVLSPMQATGQERT